MDRRSYGHGYYRYYGSGVLSCPCAAVRHGLRGGPEGAAAFFAETRSLNPAGAGAA